jgi:serine protease Do
VIASVEPGGPAQKAGLQTGDVIVGFEGKPVKSANELPRLVAATKPGTTVTLDIWRNGARRQIKATLAEFPSETVAQQTQPENRQSSDRLGLVVRELSPAQRKALGIEYGLLVEDSSGQGGQVQRGDIILAVNNIYFRNIDEFNRIVQQQPAGAIVALLVRRGDAALYIPLRVGGK